MKLVTVTSLSTMFTKESLSVFAFCGAGSLQWVYQISLTRNNYLMLTFMRAVRVNQKAK